MNRNTGMNAGQLIGTMNGMQIIGLDIAKHVFQLHTVDMGTAGSIPGEQALRALKATAANSLLPCSSPAITSAATWASCTALSAAIFLPLHLIAGIFGMNFEFIPLLHRANRF